MEDRINNVDEKSKDEIYEMMYQSLFRDISSALAVLNKKDKKSMNKAIKLLEHAQCKTQEIFVDTKQIDHESSLYTDVFMRTNLQNIGYFLKEGSTLKSKNTTSFTRREDIAEKELEDELNKLLEEEIVNRAYPSIIKYASVKEEIQFSLGMKIGAKLTLLLTSDSERDF